MKKIQIRKLDKHEAGVAADEVREVVDFLLSSGWVEDAGGPLPLSRSERERARYERSVQCQSWIDAEPRASRYELQARLKAARVAVLGLGGIGSAVAMSLAASGVSGRADQLHAGRRRPGADRGRRGDGRAAARHRHRQVITDDPGTAAAVALLPAGPVTSRREAGFQFDNCRVLLVMPSGRRRDAAQECLAADAEIHLVGVAPRPTEQLTRACDVVVVDHDLEEDPAGLDGLERLACAYPVLATSPSALRVDIWMLRSCGASGFEADTTELSAGVRAVMAGREHWPAGLGPAPSWVAEPLPYRICSFIRSRERAKFARLIHDNVLQSLEGLAMSPEVDEVARQLLVDEGARLRCLIEQWRTT